MKKKLASKKFFSALNMSAPDKKEAENKKEPVKKRRAKKLAHPIALEYGI